MYGMKVNLLPTQLSFPSGEKVEGKLTTVQELLPKVNCRVHIINC